MCGLYDTKRMVTESLHIAKMSSMIYIYTPNLYRNMEIEWEAQIK